MSMRKLSCCVLTVLGATRAYTCHKPATKSDLSPCRLKTGER